MPYEALIQQQFGSSDMPRKASGFVQSNKQGFRAVENGSALLT